MRIELTKAWAKKVPLEGEDLALAMGMSYREFIQIISGEKEPSEQCKKTFAMLFDEPVEKLFPRNGGE